MYVLGQCGNWPLARCVMDDPTFKAYYKELMDDSYCNKVLVRTRLVCEKY